MRSSRWPPKLLLVVAVALLPTTPITRLAAAPVEPSSAELAAARDLFDDGLKREEKGDFEGALASFRRVAAVKTTPAVRFHVALCLEKLGHLVDALNEFERTLADVKDDGSAGAATIAKNTGNHLTDLRARIPRLVVMLGDRAESAVVEVDGAQIVPSLYGIPLPYDPGKHVVTAHAEGRKPFEKRVELSERGAPVEVTVTMTLETPRPFGIDEPPPPKVAPSWPWPWIAAGVGVGAALGAGAMYLGRASTISQLDDACGTDRARCPESKSYLEDRGKTYTTAGNVLLGVSAVAFGAAVVLFVTAPKAEDGPSMGLAVDGSSLRWFGRF